MYCLRERGRVWAWCQLRHYATGWKRSVKKQQQLQETVFEYVGKSWQPSDRVYGWGSAVTGALGEIQNAFVLCTNYNVMYTSTLIFNNMQWRVLLIFIFMGTITFSIT